MQQCRNLSCFKMLVILIVLDFQHDKIPPYCLVAGTQEKLLKVSLEAIVSATSSEALVPTKQKMSRCSANYHKMKLETQNHPMNSHGYSILISSYHMTID